MHQSLRFIARRSNIAQHVSVTVSLVVVGMHHSLRFIACRSNTAQHVSVTVSLVVVGLTTTNDTVTTTIQR